MNYQPIESTVHSGWFEIPGYSGYLASRKGHILNKKTRYSTRGGNAGRYLKVSVYKDGDENATLQHVHDLVCRAFHGEPEGAVVVKHKNDKRWDNASTNVEWGSQSDNIKETYSRGIRKPTYGKRVSNEDISNHASLYHLSFRDNLAGLWKPQPPAGSELPSGKYPEPKTPRVSLASSVLGCLHAIYPNIGHLFEDLKYPYVNMYVYQPVELQEKDVIDQTTLTKKRHVWDAHVTGEVWVTKPVKMELTTKIKVKNPIGRPNYGIHPFGDTRLPKSSVGPVGFVWQVEKTFVDDVSLESHDNDVVYTFGNLLVEEKDFHSIIDDVSYIDVPSAFLTHLCGTGGFVDSPVNNKPIVLYQTGLNEFKLVDGNRQLSYLVNNDAPVVSAKVVTLKTLERFGFNDVVKEKPIWTDW